MDRIPLVWRELTVRVLDHAAIGAHARSLRRSHNLTLQQVARSAKISASMLSLLERGERRWSNRDAERISSAIAKAKKGKAA